MKKLLLLSLLLLATKLSAVIPPFTSITAAWDKASSHGTNITFLLKWGSVPGSTNYHLSVGTNLTATVTNPTSGFLFFHVVARTTEGLESDPSNMIVVTNYPAAPLKLQISTNNTTSLKLEGTVDGSTWILLANITNDPVVVAMRRNMMFRASTNPPPLPR